MTSTVVSDWQLVALGVIGGQRIDFFRRLGGGAGVE